MEQSWHDVLFAHWSFSINAISAALPVGLQPDIFDGKAWIGVVPFQIRGLRARYLPALPGVSTFPELNVRTYVTIDGKPGVYFFSLDAASKLAVLGARTAFHLNYYHALMAMLRGPRGIEFLSRRTDTHGKAVDFSAHYRAAGKALRPAAGTLEHFLTERYCLYSVSSAGRIYRLNIHHRPWLLQRAEAEVDAAAMLEAANIPRPVGNALLHFSPVQEAIGWLPERVR